MKEIDRDSESCTLYCDYCGDSDIVERKKYSTIIKQIKSYGWIIKKIDDEWKEFCCDECHESYMKEKVKKNDTRKLWNR